MCRQFGVRVNVVATIEWKIDGINKFSILYAYLNNQTMTIKIYQKIDKYAICKLYKKLSPKGPSFFNQ